MESEDVLMIKKYVSLIVLSIMFLAACSNDPEMNSTQTEEQYSEISKGDSSGSEQKTVEESEVLKIDSSESEQIVKEEPVIKDINQSMNLSEIEVGDYASVNGTWENDVGETIIIDQNVIKITNIYTASNERLPATISNLSIDIPSKNDETGKPAKQEWIEGEIDSYGQELSSWSENGYVVLHGNIPMASLSVAFVPTGVSDDIQVSDINKERITTVIGQNNATSVPAEQFYYRVDSKRANNPDNNPVEVEQTGNSEVSIVTKGNVLEYATDYVKNMNRLGKVRLFLKSSYLTAHSSFFMIQEELLEVYS